MPYRSKRMVRYPARAGRSNSPSHAQSDRGAPETNRIGSQSAHLFDRTVPAAGGWRVRMGRRPGDRRASLGLPLREMADLLKYL